MKQIRGTISRWDATYTYIDRQFYNDIIESEDISHLEVSLYERKLLGLKKRSFITEIFGMRFQAPSTNYKGVIQ
ncbi:hypothetical protein C6497_04675 [Candidatus Poribacteria bacterium]|nr:MAG: hypothetical protein C6497_04675 [Candidatus Poribacteria bacterium]